MAATIDDLLEQLQQINIAVKGGNTGSSDSGPSTASRASSSTRGSGDDDLTYWNRVRKAAKEAREDMDKDIQALEEEHRLVGLNIERQRELHELKIRQADENNIARARNAEQLKEALALRETNNKGIIKGNELFKEQAKELERGAGKFQLLSNKMLKVDGAANSLLDHIPMTSREFATFSTEAIESVKSGEIFIAVTKKIAAATLNLSVALEKTNAALARQHGIAQSGYGTMSEQAQVSRTVERELSLLGVTAQEAAAAQGALIAGMSSFTQLSKTQKEDLTRQAALMQELGVQTSTTAQIFDTSTKALGMGADQMGNLTKELKDTADSLGLPLSRVAQDFNVAASQLSFYGEDAVGVFKELEKQAKATGLSMQALLKIGGEAFDTFDGAAQKVGRLNAILGGPYLNSIDMLNATEEERLELLQASMDASGTMYGDLGKYQQKAIADALGVTTEEANRLFGNLSAAEELEIKHKEEMAETARKAQASMDKLANAFNHLLITMDPLFSAFEVFAEKVSWLAGTGGGKLVMRIGLYTAGFLGLVASVSKGAAAMAKLGKGLRVVGLAMRFKPFVKAGIHLSRFFGKFPSFLQMLQGFGKLLWKPFSWFGRMLVGTGGSGGGLFGAISSAASGLWGLLTTGASGMAAGVIAGVVNVAGVFMGLVKIVKGMWNDMLADGANFGQQVLNLVLLPFKLIAGAILGLADAWGSLMDLVGIDFIKGDVGFGQAMKYAYGAVSGDTATKVNDAIITTDGKVIEPNPQDTIIAAKPQGPIASMLGFEGPGAPQAGAATGSPANQTINVNVRIGERELKDIIKEVIPETITSFANP